MKFVILLEDYNLYYTKYLEKNLQVNSMKYAEKLNHLLNLKYYQSDGLAKALVKLGHEAEIIIPECNPLQLSWAKEYCISKYLKWYIQKPLRSFKARFLYDYYTYNSIQQEILLEQLSCLKPDVVFVHSNIWLERNTIKLIKSFSKKIILYWNCPIVGRWKNFAFDEFDFIFSSSMPLVNFFNKRNITSYYFQQAFNDNVLSDVIEPSILLNKAVFIGNFTPFHNYRFQVIEYLLQNGVEIDVYGGEKENLPENSILKKIIKPPVYGIEMYNKYKQYALAIHIHGEGEKNDEINLSSFAGAKRIFEITGIGKALLTSYQNNLSELFSKDEIITFTTKEECLEKVNYYLSNPQKLSKIAKAGQQKTLSQHTFNNRALTLINLITTC
jgi:hypothetical protein